MRLRCSLGRRRDDGYPPAGTRVESSAGAPFPPAHKFLQGDTRRPSRLLKATLLVACALLAIAGCGESAGVSEGATVRVYAVGALCPEAERELVRGGREAGDVRIRVVCLPSGEGDRLDLARIGANARRATEDATAIGYIGEPTRSATRFSEPILEEAGIAQLTEISGAAAMRKLLHAVDEAGDSGSLRESVDDELR